MMKRLFCSKKTWLTLAIMVMVLMISVGSTISYFTTYVIAEGSKPVSLELDTDIQEEVVNWRKQIKLSNNSNVDVYVRLVASAPTPITWEYELLNDDWYIDEEGYCVCKTPVKPGETTSQCNVWIHVPQGFTDDFNVMIYEQTTKVKYDSEGNPKAPNWNNIYDENIDDDNLSGNN